MSDREGYVQRPDGPDPEVEYEYPMSEDYPLFDDGRARKKEEIEHFSEDQGVDTGLVCREPVRGSWRPMRRLNEDFG